MVDSYGGFRRLFKGLYGVVPLPETNSEFTPENRPSQKETMLVSRGVYLLFFFSGRGEHGVFFLLLVVVIDHVV